ncbi:MAG: hypothetical protein Tsb0021_16950 [Chlamydiales bacterium]
MTLKSRLLLWFLPVWIGTTLFLSLFLFISWDLEVIPSALSYGFLIVLFVLTATITISSVIYLSHKISLPIETLKRGAIAIASGRYGEKIEVTGPQEIQELAHTLNTLSECLEESIIRIKETSLAKERLYGEYECALLLQHRMLQEVIDKTKVPNLALRLIKVRSSSAPQGFFLGIEQEDQSITFTLSQAKEPGFKAMYELLYNRTDLEKKRFPVSYATLKGNQLDCHSHEMAPPVIWSFKRRDFTLVNDQQITIEKGDLIFFYNKGFAKQFQRHHFIQSWFGKALRHFAMENFDSFSTILTNELHFLANKQHITDDLYIIAIKVDQQLIP